LHIAPPPSPLAKIASLSFLLTGKQRACELSKYCQRAVKWLVPGFVPRQIRAPSLVAQRCRLITATGQINERETPSSLTNRRQRCPCPPVYMKIYIHILHIDDGGEMRTLQFRPSIKTTNKQASNFRPGPTTNSRNCEGK